MKITKITVDFRADPSLLALVSVVFDQVFVVKYIRVRERQLTRELQIDMPSRQNKAGRWLDVCHPCTPEFGEEMQNQIRSHVKELLNGIRGTAAKA